jgi:hypothetical protein
MLENLETDNDKFRIEKNVQLHTNEDSRAWEKSRITPKLSSFDRQGAKYHKHSSMQVK